MRNRRKKTISAATAIAAVIALTVAGCGNSQSGTGGADSSKNETDNNRNTEEHGEFEGVYGQVAEVGDSEITIKIAERSKGPGEETSFTGEEQTVKATEETEVLKESGMGSAPQGEKPEGEEGKAPGPRGETQEGTGEPPQMQTEEAKLSDIKSGDLVRITLDGDSAATITIQSMPGGMPGEALETAAAEAKLSGAYTVDGKTSASMNDTYKSKDQDKSTVLVTAQGSLKMSGQRLRRLAIQAAVIRVIFTD